MKRFLAALASLTIASAAFAGVHGSEYQAAGKCQDYPRANLKTPPNTCVAIVAGPEHGLKMPRLIVPVGNNGFVLTDMGGWVGAKGRVLRLRFAGEGAVTVETIFDNLRQPHGLAMGPDGKVYVGEKGRVSRFFPDAAQPVLETVVDGLPTDGLHPLTNLIFDKDGALIVNIGAPTDRCETKSNPKMPQNPCPLTAGDRPRAALWRMTFDKAGGKVMKTEVLARGLRNSMGLALDPVIGAIVQAENGVDLPGDDEPAEELNVIAPGKHYGWPSCWGMNKPLPGVKAKDCEGYTPATALLPAHAAPLGMLYFAGPMFPQYEGRLLIAFHGYRDQGHRIVALDPEPLRQGKSSVKIENVVSGWERKRGVRPQGAPVGLAVTPGGSIWWVEDKNRTVMALFESGGAPKVAAVPSTQDSALPPPPKEWDVFARDVLKPKCSACHLETREKNPADMWAKMAELGWAGDGPLKDSKLARALTGVGPEKPMPPPNGLKADAKAKAAFERLLGANP